MVSPHVLCSGGRNYTSKALKKQSMMKVGSASACKACRNGRDPWRIVSQQRGRKEQAGFSSSSFLFWLPGGASGKEPTCQCRRLKEMQFQSLGQEDLLEKKMATHSSILSWKFHGQRSLASYSPSLNPQASRVTDLPQKPSPRWSHRHLQPNQGNP